VLQNWEHIDERRDVEMVRKKDIEKLTNKEDLEKINGLELMNRATEIHNKIRKILYDSDIPVVLGIAILESVKMDLFRTVDIASTLTLLDMLEKKKGGDE